MYKQTLASAAAYCFEQAYYMAGPEPALLLRSDALARKAFDNALIDLSLASSS